MLDTLKLFFCYTVNEYGVAVPYEDGSGGGAFHDWRHFLWIAVTIISTIVLYKVFQKHPKIGRKVIYILAILMLSITILNQTYRAIIGAEIPWTRAFPFHMCNILAYFVPFVFLFEWDKIKTATYVLGIMGAFSTLLFPDQFDNDFMTFFRFESIITHTMLLYIPIFSIAIGDWKIELKKFCQPCALALGCMGWATLANEVFFKDYDTNYMFLKKNQLPNNLGGDYFIVIYIILFLVTLLIIMGTPTLYRKAKNYITKKRPVSSGNIVE